MFKFIPIMTIITTGIIFAGIHGIDGSFFNGGTNGTNGISKLSITAIFTCLPSVMFSFDGFSSAGSISSRIKNPEKGVPLAMLSAMIVASVVYISVSLAEIFSGASSVFALAGYIGNDDAEKAFNIVIATFIFACTLFSCNGLTMAAVSTMQATAEENKIIGSKAVTKKFTKDLHAGGFYFLCTLLVVFLIFTLPCIILNGDQILDISSNAIVVVFFFIYGTMIFVALIKFHLFTILQSCLAVFSSLMCVGLAGYFLVYSSIVKLIHDANEPAGAGMLDGGSEQFKYYVVAIIF
jgi:amino acid transporter